MSWAGRAAAMVAFLVPRRVLRRCVGVAAPLVAARGPILSHRGRLGGPNPAPCTSAPSPCIVARHSSDSLDTVSSHRVTTTYRWFDCRARAVPSLLSGAVETLQRIQPPPYRLCAAVTSLVSMVTCTKDGLTRQGMLSLAASACWHPFSS